MTRPRPVGRRPLRDEGGQVLVIAVGMFILLIAMGALIIEGGNAYAQQRVTQNGSDAAAEAGATVLATRLAGQPKSDSDVYAAVGSVSGANNLSQQPAVYTDVHGNPLNADGSVNSDGNPTAVVGSVAIPDTARGVQVIGSRVFPTTIGNALGISSLTSSAVATAVTGPLAGSFLPIVVPTNIVDCDKSGDLGVSQENWIISDPGTPPSGPEYIVPLCKTGTGSFMILNLDGDVHTDCDEEVENPPSIVWNDFPVMVDTNVGNDCVKKMADYINSTLKGTVVTLPICDADCITSGGGKATYTIIGVAGFYIDYISYTNNPNNPLCQATPENDLNYIAGNGSDSCIVGWFVKWVTEGPVGTGPIEKADAIGVQLIW